MSTTPPTRTSLGAAVAALAVLLLLATDRTAEAQAPAGRREAIAVPAIDWGWEMLPVREQAQRLTVDRFKVIYDFRFTDRQPESGITFQNQITPDSAKFYQPNHYDHGNGVIAGDVDGDGALDLYFVSQLGRNELWKYLGDGRFDNVTEAAGVGLGDRLGVTAAFADIDNDSDLDLFVTTVRHGNVLFENDGGGKFRDISGAAGVDYSGHSSGAVFFDYDSDGLVDLFVTNVGTYTADQQSSAGYWIGVGQDAQGRTAFSGHLHPERTEYSLLYRNLGSRRFAEVSETVGLRDGGWNGDASFVDFNGDLHPDLYVLNMQGDDHYWENVDGRSFRERTAELFPKTPWGTMGIKFFDYNNDGRFDLLLTDMHSDMSRKVTPGFEKLKSLMTMPEEELQGGDNNIFGNAFWENLGEGRWRERSDELGLETYWPWGVSVDDLNADGWDDVLVTGSMNFPYRYGINSVLLNNRGEGFLDSEFLLGLEPRQLLTSRPWYNPEQPWLETKKPWFALDCAAADARHPLCAGRDGELIVMASIGSRSAVILDLDSDGDLDIVTNEFNDRPQVLISDLAQRRQIHWLKVRLVGRESNRDGLGATVKVFVGPRVLTKYHDGKSGYLSQSSLPLYFGLGENARVDRITILWPSGRSQTVTEGLEPDRLVEIVEE
jgi:hypothetical protein